MSRPLLAACLWVACGGEAEPAPPTEPERPAYDPSAHMLPPTAPDDPTRPPPLARVVRVENLEASTYRAGQRLGPTATLETGQSALVLDLRDGARATLEPRTTARIGDEAPAQVILALGIVHAELPPEGGSPRPPLRIGTSAGTVVLEGSGDVWVAANAAGQTWVAVIGGRAALHDFDADGNARVVDVAAGYTAVLGSTEPPAAGPRHADAARIASRAVIETASPIRAEDELPTALTALGPALDAAEAESRRGAALSDGPPPAAGSPEAATRQRALVEHGRALLRTRRALLVRFEMLRARALFAAAQGSEATDPSALQRPRVRAALDLD